MSIGRRTNDRRRRVLYSTHQADQNASTAASRREIERLREARRPTAAYGERVQRRLRGRWFSLVPVRRRTFTTLALVISTAALLLCMAHYASVTYPPLVYRPEIARPLRLDVPDSFGRFYMVGLLLASAGVALMTYQLRRYRLDDYLGRYRIWRSVLIVLLIASVNALVGLIDWTGGLLDLAFGKRVALTGGDWLRLLVGLGGAVLLLRMVAEIRRSRFSLLAMLTVCGILAIPQAAQWNILKNETVTAWTAITSAPLLASAALFLAMTSYLRLLYREVRQIDDHVGIRDRIDQMKSRWYRQTQRVDEAIEEEKRSPKVSRPPKPKVSRPVLEDEPENDSDKSEDSKPKRRWFGLRAARQAPPERDQESENAKDLIVEDEPTEPAPTKRSRFSMRLKPKVAAKEAVEEETEPELADNGNEETSGKKRGGLGSWFRRRKSDSPYSESGHTGAENREDRYHRDKDDSDDGSDVISIDPDSIDWNSMSKAEKRRMKKQLRRQDRAA